MVQEINNFNATGVKMSSFKLNTFLSFLYSVDTDSNKHKKLRQ